MGDNGDGRYDSRTEAQSWSTAARIGKEYEHDAPVSENPDKSSARTDDGGISSHEYIRRTRGLRERGTGILPVVRDTADGGCATPTAEGGCATSGGSAGASPSRHISISVDYHHPLEDYLAKRWMQRLLGFLSKPRRNGRTILEDLIESYANPAATFGRRVKYAPLHWFIRRMKGGVSDESFRERLAERRDVVRGLVATARSVAEFGLTVPQRFSTPLFAVWNFTNLCNLNCRHCYQDSGHQPLPNELTLEEKLGLVDQMAAEYVPMVAFAGGEPTLCKDLLPVLRQCHGHGIHMSLATNGTTMTPRLAGQIAEAGARYVEISLDSVSSGKHDAFRGQPGMWERTVQGMKTVVATPGLRLGIAVCIHQGNIDELEALLQFAVDIGAGCVAHFNFIPVGRGLEMAEGDLTPRQREWVLQTLNRWMQSGKLGVISTAPQLGRLALAESPLDGRQTCSHCGSGSGLKARVIAKYLGGCGAGRTYVCIEPEGNLTPCVYMPQRVLGNIRERRFRDIFRNNEFWDMMCDRDHRLHHCEVCEFKNYCGGCRARADAYYGSANAGDPGCIFNEKHWQDLVRRGAAMDPNHEPAVAEASA
jgi:radical SAM protein with 4Fe4S-binding SPASM domain